MGQPLHQQHGRRATRQTSNRVSDTEGLKADWASLAKDARVLSTERYRDGVGCNRIMSRKRHVTGLDNMHDTGEYGIVPHSQILLHQYEAPLMRHLRWNHDVILERENAGASHSAGTAF